MKKTLSMIATSVLIALGIYLFALNQPASADIVMCPAIYQPVCAKVKVQCIKAPCYAVTQTFSNSCEMGKDPNATMLYEGKCKKYEIPDGYENTVSSVLDKYLSSQDFKSRLLEAINNLLNGEEISRDKEQRLLYIKDYVENK